MGRLVGAARLSAWFLMNNIVTENVSPRIGATWVAIGKIKAMLFVGLFTSVGGLWLILPASANGSGYNVSKWLVLPLVIALTLLLLRAIPNLGDRVQAQYAIFRNPHTWVMTIIYTMTFGSFIGYSAGLPLAIKVIFGFQHVLGADGVWDHSVANPQAPSALTYAWIGPFIGAVIRPLGGWISDSRWWGSCDANLLCCDGGCCVGGGLLHGSRLRLGHPRDLLHAVLSMFMLLFLSSGIGNGSTFRTIAVVFDRKEAGPVLGWTSAVAAYGAFIIPIVFGEEINKGTPQYALYGFAAFYTLCLVLNWVIYLRPGAGFKNP